MLPWRLDNQTLEHCFNRYQIKFKKTLICFRAVHGFIMGIKKNKRKALFLSDCFYCVFVWGYSLNIQYTTTNHQKTTRGNGLYIGAYGAILFRLGYEH